MNRLVKVAIACALPMTMLACGKDDKNNPVNNIQEAAQAPELNASPSDVAQGKSKIFKGACRELGVEELYTQLRTDGDLAVKSAREQYQIAGANITHATVLFVTTDCSAGPDITVRESGGFEVINDQRTPDNARFANISYDKLTVETNTESGAKIANAIKMCDQQQWAAGAKPIEVTAQAEKATCYRTDLPRKLNTIYRVDNNTLYFGKVGPVSAADTRPTTLDMNEAYVAE